MEYDVGLMLLAELVFVLDDDSDDSDVISSECDSDEPDDESACVVEVCDEVDDSDDELELDWLLDEILLSDEEGLDLLLELNDD